MAGAVQTSEPAGAENGPPGNGAPQDVADEHAWSQLDPLVRLGVGLAGTMFCGVMVLAFFLVPYALLSNGWTPG